MHQQKVFSGSQSAIPSTNSIIPHQQQYHHHQSQPSSNNPSVSSHSSYQSPSNLTPHVLPSIYSAHQNFFGLDFNACIDHFYSLVNELNERSVYLHSRQVCRRFEQHVATLMSSGCPPPTTLPPIETEPQCCFVNENGVPIPTSKILEMFRQACLLLTSVLRRFFHEQSMPSPEQSPIPLEEFEKHMGSMEHTECIDQDGLLRYTDIEPYIEWQYMQRFRYEIRDELYHSMDLITQISSSFWSNKDLLILSGFFIEHFKAFPFSYHHLWNPAEMRNNQIRERHKSVLEVYSRIVKNIIIWLLNLVVSKYQRNTAKQFILISKEAKLEYIQNEKLLQNGEFKRSSYFKPLSPRPDDLEPIDQLLPSGLPVTSTQPNSGNPTNRNIMSSPKRVLNRGLGSNPDLVRSGGVDAARPGSCNAGSPPTRHAAFDFVNGTLESEIGTADDDDDIFEITPRVLTTHHNNSTIFDFDQDYLFTVKKTILSYCESQLRSNSWSCKRQRLIKLFSTRLKGKTKDWLKQQVLDYVCLLKRGRLFPRPPTLPPPPQQQLTTTKSSTINTTHRPSKVPTATHPASHTLNPTILNFSQFTKRPLSGTSSQHLNNNSSSSDSHHSHHLPQSSVNHKSSHSPSNSNFSHPIAKPYNEFEYSTSIGTLPNIPTTLTDREQEILYEHLFFSNRNPTSISMVPIDFTHLDDISSVYTRSILLKCLRRVLFDSQPPPDFTFPSHFQGMGTISNSPSVSGNPSLHHQLSHSLFQSPLKPPIQNQHSSISDHTGHPQIKQHPTSASLSNGPSFKPNSEQLKQIPPSTAIAQNPTSSLNDPYNLDFEPSRELLGIDDIDNHSQDAESVELHPHLAISHTHAPQNRPSLPVQSLRHAQDTSSANNIPRSFNTLHSSSNGITTDLLTHANHPLPSSGGTTLPFSGVQHARGLSISALNDPSLLTTSGQKNLNASRFNDDTDFTIPGLRSGLVPSKQQIQSQTQGNRTLSQNPQQTQSSQLLPRNIPQQSSSSNLPNKRIGHSQLDPLSTNFANTLDDSYRFSAEPALSVVSTSSLHSTTTINSTQLQPLFTQVFTDSFRHHTISNDHKGRSREMIWFDKLFETTFYDISYCTYQLIRLIRLTRQYVILQENNNKKIETLRLKQKKNYLDIQLQFKNHQHISHERRLIRGQQQMGIDIPLKHFYTKQLQTLTARQQTRLTGFIRDHGVIVLKRQQQLVVLERHILRRIKQTVHFVDLLLRHWIKIHALQQYNVNGFSDDSNIVIGTIDVPTRASRLHLLYTALHHTTLCSSAFYNYTRYFHSNPFSFSDLCVVEKNKTIQTVPRYDSSKYNDISPHCSVRLINGNSSFFSSFGQLNDLADFKTFQKLHSKLGITASNPKPKNEPNSGNSGNEFFIPGTTTTGTTSQHRIPTQPSEITFRTRRRRLDRTRLKRTLNQLTHAGMFLEVDNSSEDDSFIQKSTAPMPKGTISNTAPAFCSKPNPNPTQYLGNGNRPPSLNTISSTSIPSSSTAFVQSLALITSDQDENYFSSDFESDVHSPNFLLAFLHSQSQRNQPNQQGRKHTGNDNFSLAVSQLAQSGKYYPEEEQCSDEEEGEIFFKSCDINTITGDQFHPGSFSRDSFRASGTLIQANSHALQFHEDKTPEIENLRSQILSMHGQPQSGLFSITEGQSVSVSPLIKRKESIHDAGNHITHVVRKLLVLVSLYTCNCSLNSNQPSFQAVQSNGCKSELIDDFLDGKFQDYNLAQRTITNLQSNLQFRTLYRHGDMYIVYLHLKLFEERNSSLQQQGKKGIYSTTQNQLVSLNGKTNSSVLIASVHSKNGIKSSDTIHYDPSSKKQSHTQSTRRIESNKSVKSKSKYQDSSSPSLTEESSENEIDYKRNKKNKKDNSDKKNKKDTKSTKDEEGRTKRSSSHRKPRDDDNDDDSSEDSNSDDNRKHSSRRHRVKRRQHCKLGSRCNSRKCQDYHSDESYSESSEDSTDDEHHRQKIKSSSHKNRKNDSSSSSEGDSSDDDRRNKKDKKSSSKGVGNIFSRIFGGKK